MSFRMKRALALKVCTDQVEKIVVMPRYRNTVWTTGSLHELLLGIGLDYTLQEVSLINEELHNRGVVEDIQE